MIFLTMSQPSPYEFSTELLLVRAAVPTLEQRRSGAEQEVRGADARCQQQQHVECGHGLSCKERLSGVWTCGKQWQAGEQQRDVDQTSSAVAPNDVGIGVAGDQDDLEKEQADSPNAGASAQPRQDVSARERLHRKEQKRTEEDREGEEPLHLGRPVQTVERTVS